MFKITRGNILESKANALVNPINCTPAMGKGLALQFRNQVPGLYEAHQIAARAGMLLPGRLHLFYSPERGQTIIGLPTKRDWRDNSRLEDVIAGLVELRKLLEDTPSWGSIAIPPLGCGLGGLDWKVVSREILRIFMTMNQVIEVYEPTRAG